MSEGATDRFFISGGTLPVNAVSYVARRADDELLHALLAGEFCYILTSRQVGKSSLMVRAAAALRRVLQPENGGVSVVDLTVLGQNTDCEQWYCSLLAAIGLRLDLEDELEAHWGAHPHLSPLQRWMAALRGVALARRSGRVVIFLDEIDMVRSLPFPTDELLAAIRACYNLRAEAPAFSRLTFCLLGVAAPADLIQDTRLTPFNIGRRIELGDFTPEEAAPLVQGLVQVTGDERIGARLLERVLYWTGGHPYLTQKLCRVLSESFGPQPLTLKLVDALCADYFLAPNARERDDNLLFVRDRLLAGNECVAALEVFGRVVAGRPVAADEKDQRVSRLLLAGVVRSDRMNLRLRNRIYERVFDKAWIRLSMPGAELRRQRLAFRRGALRMAGVSLVVLAMMGCLALVALHQAARATASEAAAEELLYDADMDLASYSFDAGNYPAVAELLSKYIPKAGMRDRREFVWRYLWRLMNRDQFTLHGHPTLALAVAVSADGKLLATGGTDKFVHLWDLGQRKEITRLPGHSMTVTRVAFAAHARILASASDEERCIWIWDLARSRKSSRVSTHDVIRSMAISPDASMLAVGQDTQSGFSEIDLWRIPSSGPILSLSLRGPAHSLGFSPDGRTLAVGLAGRLALYDLRSGRMRFISLGARATLTALAYAPGGDSIALGSGSGDILWVSLKTGRAVPLQMHHGWVAAVSFTPDGRFVASAGWDGTVHLTDLRTRRERELVGHADRVNGLAFAGGGRWLDSVGSDEVKVWELGASPIEPRAPAHSPSDPRKRAISPDARLTAAAVSGGWELDDRLTGKPVAGHRWQSSPSQFFCFSTDGSRAGATSEYRDGSAEVSVRITMSGDEVFHTRYGEPVFGLALSTDGQLLAVSCGSKGRVEVWNLNDHAMIAILRAQNTNTLLGLSFSPDDLLLASGSFDGLVTLWSMKDPLHGRSVRGHRGQAAFTCFSPDGRTLASACDEGGVKLWDPATMRELGTIHTPAGLTNYRFTGDGNALEAFDSNLHPYRWQAATWAEVEAREGHKRPGFSTPGAR